MCYPLRTRIWTRITLRIIKAALIFVQNTANYFVSNRHSSDPRVCRIEYWFILTSIIRDCAVLLSSGPGSPGTATTLDASYIQSYRKRWTGFEAAIT